MRNRRGPIAPGYVRRISPTACSVMPFTGSTVDDMSQLRLLAKQYARLVTERTGGFGAAREVCEFILEAQGTLDAALAPYLPQSHSAAAK